MRFILSVVTLALALVAAAFDEPKTERPEDFNRWADDRVEVLREEPKVAGSQASGREATERHQATEKVDALKQRLDKVEGELDKTGTSNAWSTWQDRKDIRDELQRLDRDVDGLRKDLERP